MCCVILCMATHFFCVKKLSFCDISDNSLLIPQSKRFKSNSSYRRHKCETCKKRLPSRSQLNIHKRVHSKQKPFTCDQCQNWHSIKSFIQEKKPYTCDSWLTKNFERLHHSTNHKKLDSGERDHINVAHVLRNFDIGLV